LEIEDNLKNTEFPKLLVWDDFCSWFLEMIKPAYQQPIDSVTFDRNAGKQPESIASFYAVLTEEIWQWLQELKKKL
jgi:valyl-tRNA synthetase